MQEYIVPNVRYYVEELADRTYDVWFRCSEPDSVDDARSEADFYAAKHRTKTRVRAVENGQTIGVIAEYGK